MVRRLRGKRKTYRARDYTQVVRHRSQHERAME